MAAWSDVRYFTPEEFDSPDLPGTGQAIDLQLVLGLDEIRDAIGRGLFINSGVRTPAHNSDIAGSVDGSAHVKLKAADIRARSSSERFDLVALASRIVIHELTGELRLLKPDPAERFLFTRIGVGETFVHLDVDASKPQRVLWLYR